MFYSCGANTVVKLVKSGGSGSRPKAAKNCYWCGDGAQIAIARKMETVFIISKSANKDKVDS